MIVLADLHHGVLFEALAMLFEDRGILGERTRLIAWVDGQYVREPGPAVADFPPRKVQAWTSEDVEWSRQRVGVVIASAPSTREPLRELAGKVGALYVDHVGNAWDPPVGKVVLRSALGPGEDGVPYHPEFHRVPWTIPRGNVVGSFHGSFESSPCRKRWDELATPEWRLYGTTDDPLYPWEVAGARSRCVAQWHCKDADGYGFAVHEAFAAGRVVIGHRSHYTGKIAEPLFVRGETHVEPDEDIRALLSDEGRMASMGEMAMRRFNEVVDFDREAGDIAGYLGGLL